MNANRFFIAFVILKADGHKITGLKHLGGGLGEPRLVTVDRR